MDPDLSLRHRGEAQVVWDQDQPVAPGSSGETMGPLARPLIRPAPRSAMVFPLVVLVAVLPGMVALNSWDLTPPGPLWGFRGLVVLDGHVLDQMPAADEIKPVPESAAFRRWLSSRRSTPGWRRWGSGSVPTVIRWPVFCPATWPAGSWSCWFTYMAGSGAAQDWV